MAERLILVSRIIQITIFTFDPREGIIFYEYIFLLFLQRQSRQIYVKSINKTQKGAEHRDIWVFPPKQRRA